MKVQELIELLHDRDPYGRCDVAIGATSDGGMDVTRVALNTNDPSLVVIISHTLADVLEGVGEGWG